MVAETIYMVHGMCGGAWVWNHYRSSFESQGYRCVATTLRHHDIDPRERPPVQLGTTGLLDYVEDLLAEVDRLGGEPIVMGHSIGGLLAQMLATRVPVKALVLLAPVPPAGIVCLKPAAVRGFASILLRWGWWKTPVRCTFKEAAFGMLQLLPVQDQRKTHARFVYESGRAAFESGFWFLDPNPPARINASQVTCPVLALAGGMDRLAPASMVRRIAARYEPRSTFHVFPRHAHWLVAEPGWQEVTQVISGWLDRTVGLE